MRAGPTSQPQMSARPRVSLMSRDLMDTALTAMSRWGAHLSPQVQDDHVVGGALRR